MTGNIEIHIEDIGPIRDSRIELKPFMVFSGESGTGKSYTALLVHYIYRVLCNNDMSGFLQRTMPRTTSIKSNCPMQTKAYSMNSRCKNLKHGVTGLPSNTWERCLDIML